MLPLSSSSSSDLQLSRSTERMATHQLQIIPPEIRDLIFNYCDYETLKNLAEAYPEYDDEIHCHSLCLKPEANLTRCSRLAEELSNLLDLKLKPSTDEPSSSTQQDELLTTERDQLKFLLDTLKWLKTVTEPVINYIKDKQIAVISKNEESDWKIHGKHFRGISLLSDSLLGVMNELSDFLTNHFSNLSKPELSDNFDIFDLCIRQKLYELGAFFPQREPVEGAEASSPVISDPLTSPLEVIACPEGREMWRQAFGEKYSVKYDDFIEKIIIPIFPEESKEISFINTLSYFINFPKNTYITSYKWDLFIKLFGPLSQVSSNFTKCVLERGFLGHINRLSAKKILLEQYKLRKKPLYILRFSRTVPDSLALSFIQKINGKLRISNKLTKQLEDSGKGLVDRIFIWRYHSDSDPVPYRTEGGRIVVEQSSFARLSYAKQDFYDVIIEE